MTLNDVIEDLKPKKPVVHGLKKLTESQVAQNLPFKITGKQQAYTCLCNSGWLCITDDPKEAFKNHMKG